MKGLFHKRPNFSFSALNFNNTKQQNNDPPDQQQSHSQPSSPRKPHFDGRPIPEPPHTAGLPSDPKQAPTSFSQLMKLKPQPCVESVIIGISSTDPLQLVRIDSASSRPQHTRGKPSWSEGLDSDRSAPQSRRGSLADSIAEEADRGRVRPSSTASGGGSHLSRHRKRISNLFSHHPTSSRSPSPNPSTSRLRSPSHELSSHPYESDPESFVEITPVNAFDLESDSQDETDTNGSAGSHSTDEDADLLAGPEDETILANTTANASSMTPTAYLQTSEQPEPFIDQAPNLTVPPAAPLSFSSSDPRRSSAQARPSNRKNSLHKSSSIRSRKLHNTQDLKLTVSRPIYERNRCTVNIEHGDYPEAVRKAERTRSYLVASDLSDESKYAIEWAIGTVLRQGDECLIISIIETESKFDPEDGGTTADRTAKIRNQKDRQEKATLLVREATALLERTRLNVKVTCQAVHAKNSRHMLLDCIDFLQPNLVIVGSRGLTSLKGGLMGSVSHYLVQKSSVPVMVARRKLSAPPKVYNKKRTEFSKNPRMSLQEAAIENSSKATLIEDKDGDGEVHELSDQQNTPTASTFLEPSPTARKVEEVEIPIIKRNSSSIGPSSISDTPSSSSSSEESYLQNHSSTGSPI